MATRDIEVGERRLTLHPGETRRLAVRTDGAPLVLNVNVPNAPLGGRVLGVKVLALSFAA